MSKQVISDKRKGLVSKSETKAKEPPKLIIGRQIDDLSLWYVEIDEKGVKSRRPCKKSTLEESFKLGKTTWNVKVLGQWVNMDGNSYISYERKFRKRNTINNFKTKINERKRRRNRISKQRM